MHPLVRLVAVALVVGLAIRVSFAQEAQLSLEIASIEGEQGSVRGLHVELEQQTAGTRILLRAAALKLSQWPQEITGLQMECPLSTASWPAIDCAQASLRLDASPWGPQQLKLALTWDGAQRASLSLEGLRLGAGRLDGRLEWDVGRWQVRVHGKTLQLAELVKLVGAQQSLPLAQLQGLLELTLQAKGEDQQPLSIDARGALTRVNYANSSGTQAGEQLAADFSFAAKHTDQTWRGAAQFKLRDGGLYSEPLFLDFKARPLSLLLDGSWAPEQGRVELRQLRADSADALRINGNLQVDLAKLGALSADLRLESDALQATFDDWVQPWLLGTPLQDWQLQGKGGAHVRLQQGVPVALDLALVALYAQDKASSSGVDNLNAHLHWRASGETPPSEITLAEARLGKLSFGTTRVRALTAGQTLYLQQPVEVPFFGGEIVVPKLTLVRTGSEWEAGFSVDVRQVSLKAFSQALGWPPMLGSINASLPGARLQGKNLQVDGDIGIQAFDGQLLIQDLRLRELGTPAPRLDLNLRLTQLDLAKLTETFSFGRIQGRVDGDVRDLQLVAWLPNRFDAHVYSSPDDDLPHRISQRAVENLSSVSGGVSGALSSGALSVFQDFAYDRIDLKVSQRGAQAGLDGIPHKGGGFYIVKGAWLPRIDVIGYNRKVDWKTLVERLQSVRLESPRIE